MPAMQVYSLERHHIRRIGVIVAAVIFLTYWTFHGREKTLDGHLGKSLGHVMDQGEDSPDVQLPADMSGTRVGLTIDDGKFHLDGKPFTIIGGSIHYFRIPPQYWKDRLLKMKAAGLNTVTTYIAWNVHEQIKGSWSWTGQADLRQYIKLAAEVGFLVILRPGPFICAEWEYGGLPSWLLHDPDMQIRSTYQPFIDVMNKYFGQVLDQVRDLQFSEGGPIIGFQVENEYGVFGANDPEYLKAVKESLLEHGVVEALFSSGNVWLETEAIPGVHLGINFQDYKAMGLKLIDKVHRLRPGQPLIVMEYWTGWFDHWGEIHHTWATPEVTGNLTLVLQAGASVNMYVFAGGSNFGFMNGANAPGGQYTPTVTSYDYDAPLSEAGDMTMKYSQIKETLQKYAPEGSIPSNLPAPPPNAEKGAYGSVKMTSMLHWEGILSLAQAIDSQHLVPMEMLDINNGGGQGYGFIVYRKQISSGSMLKFTSPARDRATVLLNSKEVESFTWEVQNKIVPLGGPITTSSTLDIVVENMGRVNIAGSRLNILNQQRKGLEYPVQLDGQAMENWKIYPLEFKQDFISNAQSYTGWEEEMASPRGPAMYRTAFTIEGEPKDTFINMQGWNKGCVFINDFNVGRYWSIGPQKALFVPATVLRSGSNDLIIFELHQPGNTVDLVDHPILG